LFTAGRDTTKVSASAWSATGALLKSIWDARAEAPRATADAIVNTASASAAETLPARSLVVPPQPQAVRLSDLVEMRRKIAA
jgi:hypothetical protein